MYVFLYLECHPQVRSRGPESSKRGRLMEKLQVDTEQNM